MLTEDTQSVKPASFKQVATDHINQYESEIAVSHKVLSGQYKLNIVTNDGTEVELPEGMAEKIQKLLNAHYADALDKAKSSLLMKISDALFYQNYETVE